MKLRAVGFSLMEVIIAMGLLGVGGYFLASLLHTGSMGQKTLMAQDDARQLTDNMATVLQNNFACANTFGGGFPSLNPMAVNPVEAPDSQKKKGPGNTVTNIVDAGYPANGSPTTPPKSIFAVGNSYGNRGLSLARITIGGGAGVHPKFQLPYWSPGSSNNTGTAIVEVDWVQTGSAGNRGIGAQHLLRYFIVNVTNLKSDNTIATCTAQPGGGGGNMGSGTANFLAKWRTDDTLTSSMAFFESPDGLVGVGTTTPVTTLDINGTARLAVNSAAPFACDSLHEGAIALNNSHQLCVCSGTTGWVASSDGISDCAFGSGPSCQPSGAACSASKKCCSGLSCDLATSTCATSGGQCKNEGDICSASQKCCSGLSCNSSGRCSTSGGQCKNQGDYCAADIPCCNGLICGANARCLPTTAQCVKEGYDCVDSSACCTGLLCDPGKRQCVQSACSPVKGPCNPLAVKSGCCGALRCANSGICLP